MSKRMYELGLVLSRTSNPWRLIADKLGFQNKAYAVKTKNGEKFELRNGDSGDRFAFYEIVLRGDYTQFGQTINPGDTVIDVGANVGFFTVLASKLVGPTGRVIAIEPEPETFSQLQKNIQLNGSDNVVLYNAALGATEGVVKLFKTENFLFSSIYNAVDGKLLKGSSFDVSMITPQKIFDEQNISQCNYLKLDCEGAEFQILEAIQEKTFQKIDQICIEIHRVEGWDPECVSNILSKQGFDLMSSTYIRHYQRN